MSTALTYEYENQCRAQMLTLIREQSVRVVPAGEEFTLSSGEKSRVYCDLKKSALLHEAAEPLAALILSKASGLGKMSASSPQQRGLSRELSSNRSITSRPPAFALRVPR